MNEALISNWNKLVGPSDQVYHLGDVAFSDPNKAIQILRRLNGTKFLLIGNHDHKNLKNSKFVEQFAWVKDRYQLQYNKKMYVLDHYPLSSWNGSCYKSRHLHAHFHGNMRSDGLLRLDVGVDTLYAKYSPINIDTAEEIIQEKQQTGFDKYFDNRMKDPSFAEAYFQTRQEISVWQKLGKLFKKS